MSGNGSQFYGIVYQKNTENERRPESSLKCRTNSDWGQGGGRWKERERGRRSERQGTQMAGGARRERFSGVDGFSLRLETAVHFPAFCAGRNWPPPRPERLAVSHPAQSRRGSLPPPPPLGDRWGSRAATRPPPPRAACREPAPLPVALGPELRLPSAPGKTAAGSRGRRRNS